MNIFTRSIPDPPPLSVVQWAVESGIKVDGHTYDPAQCPQAVEPMECMSVRDKITRIATYIKPVQSGGSTAGEVVQAYWAKYFNGFIQNNWQDDKKAAERWVTRILKCLESAPLDWAGGRDLKICQARFAHSFLQVQGVFSESALNADTVGAQVNEEIHLWRDGELSKARDRQTRVFLPKALDISNAFRKKSQLHLAFINGTMQEWETFCPECGKRHFMHFTFDKNKPELGGLRYNADTRLADGRPNYNKLEPTIRYQFPCGHECAADEQSRRRLKGAYSEPKNEGAHPSHKSFISEAVSYDRISWLTLIQEWHSAIQALKAGDKSLVENFRMRRECRFYDNDMLPYQGTIVYDVRLKMRSAMPGAILRTAKFDWQAGYKAKGELEHYWGVIFDVDINANSQLVWEGKCNSNAELLAELDAHGVDHRNAWIDCTGVQKKRHLQFCYQNGLNAVSLDKSRQSGFLHPDKVRRFYSDAKPIFRELNQVPVYPIQTGRDRATGEVIELPHPDEPVVVELHKGGLLAFYFFIRNMKANILKENPAATDKDYIRIDIPNDVSEDFKQMLESWEMIPGHRGNAKDESVDGFKPRSNFDHQLMNVAYHCFELEWNFYPGTDETLIGHRLSELGLPTVGSTDTQS